VIVRTIGDGVQLITQPDHAHLARSIMEHCVAFRDHPRRADVLLAIGEHDNGWAEEDASPSVDSKTGAVIDFVNASLWVRHTVWPRGVARLAERPFAAALVAQHAITVYDRFRVEHEWGSFFEGMEKERDRMLRTSGLAAADLQADYPFVRLGDLISLAFCAGWSEEQRFGDWRVALSGDGVIVTPDPFGGRVIPIAVQMREIRPAVFQSDEDLRATLTRAGTTVLRGEVSGG
jgi:hypothetical protein